MKLPAFLQRNKSTKGLIKLFGLTEWWISTFTEDERQYIREKYNPMGLSDNRLDIDDIQETSETDIRFLHTLSSWFSSPADRHIEHKMRQKATELISGSSDVLDVHFLYGGNIALYYKDRENPEYFSLAIEFCKKQIALSPKVAKAFKTKHKNSPLPNHKGFEQLAIILEKQKDFAEAIKLCEQAKKEGWAGDWEKRIERCKARLK